MFPCHVAANSNGCCLECPYIRIVLVGGDSKWYILTNATITKYSLTKDGKCHCIQLQTNQKPSWMQKSQIPASGLYDGNVLALARKLQQHIKFFILNF
ncbi:unnamed protein product [Sphenostylis stenocarpa]|uniref:Uncharacterized protein n=1 Tax=Sphenostylis stenocarpa TaxID=92480 RepID=A0AA86SSL8_9FABA|nr:unnamed protein product [Sphenostylis stenocarpa]